VNWHAWLALAVAIALLGQGRIGPARHRVEPTDPDRRPRLPLVAALGVAGVAVLLGGRVGLFGSPVLAVTAGILVGHLVRTHNEKPPDDRSVALLLDLMASALSGGAPPARAIAVVSSAVHDCQSAELIRAVAPLHQVGRLLDLGADPESAWATLGVSSGYESVAAAGRRCCQSGARLSPALRSVATDLRARHHADALARAERVGVWSLLPLGLCFLPAFVCIGVLPVVAAVANQVLAGVAS